MISRQSLVRCALVAVASLAPSSGLWAETGLVQIENSELLIQARDTSGQYTLRERSGTAQLTAGIAAKVNGGWLHSSDYPKHSVGSSLGEGTADDPELTITNTGLPGKPDLICRLRLYSRPPHAEIQVEVRNTTPKQLEVQALRVVEFRDAGMLDLGGPEFADRILSDSFSEDRPAMAIHDLPDAPAGVHKGVGSQLIYNRQSGQSLFLGALTSDRWLTVLRLRVQPQAGKITGYEVDSVGTTELATENSLQTSAPEDRIELSLPLPPASNMLSEKVMAVLGTDYHAHLEAYGNLIRDLHYGRVSLPAAMGWWSWTAYYFGLNQGAALTNAQLLSEHLKDFGYTFFHIDEGYQYARGEYTTPNVTAFPEGMQVLERQAQTLGLTPGIWTAPFEVSERSWVYRTHKDWLVHNAQHQPIHAGFVINEPDRKKQLDALYVLDITNPGAQTYLRETYRTLARDWGIRYIKLDFMDDTAIEGHYFRAHTTALEAQRMGLQLIREAVGEDVILDKDGSPMLNPVGIVDCGRISQDTGHTFESSRDAATGIAARYYMNRNFFIGDPDAFTVSRQTVDEQEWHGGKRPLTLDEARVSIALAAVAGGMFEIGDDLPTLFLDQDRMALVENHDLINMARYGHASTPLDLMNYAPEDEIPSTFILHESKRQIILAVFNWTAKERQRHFTFSELGLGSGNYQTSGILEREASAPQNADSLSLTLRPQSVQMLKIIDTSIPPAAPIVSARVPERVAVGQARKFLAESDAGGVPALGYHWDFGDGTSSTGQVASHTFTHPGAFTIHLIADGIEGIPFEKEYQLSVTGSFDTRFDPGRISKRASPKIGRSIACDPHRK
jgi:alpha-galactosidase